MNKFIPLAVFAALTLPAFAHAQTLFTFGGAIINIINGVLVPLVFAVAFIVFIWGVFWYFIAKSEDEDGKKKARSLMLYGIIGFFVMVSVWGLVNILLGTFNLQQNAPTLPGVPGPR
ncbi:pilin [Candidatus Parcubacteria bacterium]|nr:pilin [Candidatus Parcubacteria bacterium]